MHLFLGCILLHLLQCLQFNAHEIYETTYKSEMELTSSKVNYIGVGVYTSVALLNHDCYPAITRYFRGKEIIAKAVRPLKPGENVAENYGPIFTLRTKAERQRSLMSRYWFTCTCVACTQDWPKLLNLNENVIRLRCQAKGCDGCITSTDQKKPKLRCPKCDGIVNNSDTMLLVKSYFEDYEHGLALMNAGKLQDAAQLLSAFSDAMHVVCCPPIKTVSLAHEALRKCWAYHYNKHIVNY